jgi:hypothetical protein
LPADVDVDVGGSVAVVPAVAVDWTCKLAVAEHSCIHNQVVRCSRKLVAFLAKLDHTVYLYVIQGATDAEYSDNSGLRSIVAEALAAVADARH